MSFSFIPLKAFRFTEIARYGQPMKSNMVSLKRLNEKDISF